MKETRILPIIIGALTGLSVSQSIMIAKNRGDEQIVTEVITSTSEETIIKTEEGIFSISDDNVVVGDTIFLRGGKKYKKV